MNTLKRINNFRRKFTQSLTKNLSSSHANRVFDKDELPEIKRVLVCRPNHRLGNLILITPIIQEVISTFPECKIDLFVKGGLAPIVFQNYSNIDRSFELPKKPFKQLFKYIRTWVSIRQFKYDLVINVTSKSSSGRLITKFSKSTFKLFGDESDEYFSDNTEFKHIAINPVYNFRHCIGDLGYSVKDKDIPSLNIKLSKNEINEGQKTLSTLVTDKKETICLFTFATGKKCYSQEWWIPFYEKLKEEYKNYNIVEVLPVENISQIGFKAPSFYSKDIREICAFIANTKVFIGADSGIMHLASASFTPTIGLFSVTNQNKYRPYNNKSIAFNTKNQTIPECIKILNGLMLKN